MLNLFPFFALTVTISGESSFGNQTSSMCSEDVEWTFMGGESDSGGERRFRADGDSGKIERMLSASDPPSDEGRLPVPRLLVGVGGVVALGTRWPSALLGSMSDCRCFARMDGDNDKSREEDMRLLGPGVVRSGLNGSEWRRA